MPRHRLALLISGSGTTMAEIIKASQSGELQLDISCVLASTPQAGGIEKARKLGIPPKDIIMIDSTQCSTQDQFGKKILQELQKRTTTVVTQNGWLPLTPPNIIEAFQDKIFNQHPGPLPDFGGKGMFGRRVLAATLLFRRMTKKDMWTEVIAQRVDKEFDKGVVVKSEIIEILADDTVETLQQRVLPIEHKIQIEMLKDFINNSLVEEKRETTIASEETILLEEAKRIAKLLYPKG